MKDQLATLNPEFTFRSGTPDDLEALLEILNEYWETMTGMVKFTLDDFRSIFSTPGFDMASSLQVVTSPKGEMIAAVMVMDLADPPIHPNIYGCIRKGFEGQGIGTYLLQWGEERARQVISRCPEGARVSMYLQTSQSHQPTIRLFDKLNLTPVRFTWFMARSLDEKSPDPIWPGNIQIKTYQDVPDLEAVLRATDEAFEDHWGHVDRSGDKERVERYRHSIETNDDFDPTIWYLAIDRDEIAGMALCDPRVGEDRSTGVVDVLGVRRSWRRQGLGLALLHHAFNEFYERGYKQVILGVDTQNLTGATRLYEKAGMSVARELAIYEKELRAGEELAKQSA